jgi:hypothetical protein
MDATIQDLLAQAQHAPGVSKIVGQADGLLAQGVAAFQGPSSLLAPITSAISGPLTNALHLKQDQATQVGGQIGMTAGTAVFGPIGGAVGQVFGTALVGGLEAAFPTKKQQRADRERAREIEDLGRLAQFLGGVTAHDQWFDHHTRKFHHYTPAARKTSAQLYQAFMRGDVAWQVGIPGSEKDSERKFYRVVNGKVTEISGDAFQKLRKAWWSPSTTHLVLTSNKMSDVFVRIMLQVELEREAIGKALAKLLAEQQNAHTKAVLAASAAAEEAARTKSAAAKKKKEAAHKEELKQRERLRKVKLAQQREADALRWEHAKAYGGAMLYALVGKV